MDKVQPIIDQIAIVLRGLIAQLAPQAKAIADGLPNTVLVVLVAVALIVALIFVFSVFNAIGSLFRPRRRRRRRREEDDEPAPVQEFRRDEPPVRQVAPASAAAGRADPVEKMRREATANAARIKEDSTALQSVLVKERERVSSTIAFAQVIPNTALALVADSLAGADEPALAAARRKIQSSDFEGARTDLRRYAEGPGLSNAAAWRNLATLEGLSNLEATVKGFERARELDPKQFVTAVTLRRLYSGSGRLDEGRQMAQVALSLAKGEREQAVALDEVGEACMFLKDAEGARQAFDRGLQVVRGMSERAPLDVELRRDVAVSHFKLARLGGDASRDHLAQSIAAFERIKAAGKLAADDQQALKQLKDALADMDRQDSA
jgi:tetratricopeptide (TPR) repeat protein